MKCEAEQSCGVLRLPAEDGPCIAEAGLLDLICNFGGKRNHMCRCTEALCMRNHMRTHTQHARDACQTPCGRRLAFSITRDPRPLQAYLDREPRLYASRRNAWSRESP